MYLCAQYISSISMYCLPAGGWFQRKNKEDLHNLATSWAPVGAGELYREGHLSVQAMVYV